MSRRIKISCEDFLRAVRRVNSTSPRPIAGYLGVGKSTVWDWMQRPENEPCILQANDYLASINGGNVTATKMTFELYKTLPKIREWEEAMGRRMVSEAKQNAWMRSFFNVCRHLNRLPGKITVEECAKLVVEQRNRYYADQPQIRGIAYSVIRESVRGYFMSVGGITAMNLTNLGVGKEALKGSGKYSRQRVPPEVRHSYEKILVGKMQSEGDIKYFEAMGNSKFCFSTGTRISASLAFDFEKHQYDLKEDKWMFEIWDKGTRGKKLRWEKILMGSLLDEFKNYTSQRFDIPKPDLEEHLPVDAVGYLFPAFVIDEEVKTEPIREIVKAGLIEAGIPYKDFPPTHIWRHTFAQDFLRASDWNYELCASLGGWVNTMILKKHYGQMGEGARERGLLRAMGFEVPDVTYELRW